MGKIYSSDREICFFFKNDFHESSCPHVIPQNFLTVLPDLFDKSGFFIPRKLNETAQHRESLFEDFSRSPYRELRYLGLAGLMTLEKDRHVPLFWDGFYDSFYPVRKLFIEKWENRERTRLFNEIFKRLTGDPRQLVREAAYGRIKRDFSDLFSIRINSFSAEEQYRLIMFLDSHTVHDQAFLAEFIEGEDEALASRALYRLQLDGEKISNRWPERTKKLKLLRYATLFSFCHGSQDCFPPAFRLIDEHTPPGLASKYISELIGRPFNEEWKGFYRKACLLIGKMKGPRSVALLELFYKNRSLWKELGSDTALAFTAHNQYYTANLLKMIIHENRDGTPEKALSQAAEGFAFPLE